MLYCKSSRIGGVGLAIKTSHNWKIGKNLNIPQTSSNKLPIILVHINSSCVRWIQIAMVRHWVNNDAFFWSVITKWISCISMLIHKLSNFVCYCSLACVHGQWMHICVFRVDASKNKKDTCWHVNYYHRIRKMWKRDGNINKAKPSKTFKSISYASQETTDMKLAKIEHPNILI